MGEETTARTRPTAKQRREAAHENGLLAAMHGYPYALIAPDVPAPRPGFDDASKHTEGWTFYAHAEGRVWRAWSESNRHGDGEYIPSSRTRSASQGGLALYSTEALALQALRAVKAREAAEVLLRLTERIDAMPREWEPCPTTTAALDALPDGTLLSGYMGRIRVKRGAAWVAADDRGPAPEETSRTITLFGLAIVGTMRVRRPVCARPPVSRG